MGGAKDSTAEAIEAPGFEGRYGETEGYTIGFERYTDHADMAPMFVGLPDDRCQCPHWGYVFKGKLVYHMPTATSRSPTARPTTWDPVTRRRSSRTPRSSSSARPPS